MANFTFTRVVDIMRRVISRRNTTDTLSTDDELMQYIGEFIRDLMTQEIKNFEHLDIYNFSTVANDYIYTFNSSDTGDIAGGSGQEEAGNIASGADANGNEFENLYVFAWSVDPDSSSTQTMNFFQNAIQFYNKWGLIEDLTDAQTGRPTDILFYNNRFELRPVPDDTYSIMIPGFRRNPDYSESIGENLPFNYWGRYIAYGASLDYMYDFGYDVNRIMAVEKRYRHYKALVHGRTYNQLKQETPIQRW